MLYENQAAWSEAKDIVPIFVDYAKQIGLDTDRFMRDLNGEGVAQRIFQDGKRAHSLGVNSTPTFFVNGKEAKDDWKPEGLRKMINEALRQPASSYRTASGSDRIKWLMKNAKMIRSLPLAVL